MSFITTEAPNADQDNHCFDVTLTIVSAIVRLSCTIFIRWVTKYSSTSLVISSRMSTGTCLQLINNWIS